MENTSALATVGTFANLPDGGTVVVGTRTLQANYEGGDGNDPHSPRPALAPVALGAAGDVIAVSSGILPLTVREILDEEIARKLA